MPVMDGWQFIEEYTAIERPPKSDPILLYVVSSSIRDADVERARSYSEVSGYIIKPITLDNLKEVFESDIKKLK